MSLHRVPEHPAFRPGTIDRAVWGQVIEGNEYRLPEHFAGPHESVLDLGAHTGAFSWRCAMSGARVVAVEASRENYHLLCHNLRQVWDRVLTVNAAVWRSDVPTGELSVQPNWEPMNTGGGTVMGDATTAPAHGVLALPLDDLLRLRPEWALVKIDVEGAEFPVLYTSKELGRVRAIAGEYHRRHACLSFADAGPCDVTELRAFLEAEGFAVEVEPKGEGMGLFFARRAA